MPANPDNAILEAPGGLSGATERAPLSGYSWSALSTVAAQAITLVEVEARPASGGGFFTQPFTNREASSVGLSPVEILKANPNRTKFYLTNNGQVPIFIFHGSDVSTTKGYVIQGNGGFVRVVGNDVTVVAAPTSRAALADRSPTRTVNVAAINAGAALRTLTTEFTYTVPAGRTAQINLLSLRVYNDSTLASNGAAYVLANYTPSGGAASVYGSALMPQGNAGGRVSEQYGNGQYILAGDAIDVRTASNNNAAGTSIFLEATLHILEGAI